MLRKTVLVGAICAAMGVPTVVFANVYASGLQPEGTQGLSYILNEDATAGVTIEVWEVGGGMVYSEALGTQTKGGHSWTWNGTGKEAGKTYTAKITAAATGYSDWTKTTTDSEINNFYGPRGVAVNNNQDSAFFGRVYVCEGRGATTSAGRTTIDGLYLLNADLSSAGGSKTGGVAWNTGTENSSPFRVAVGPDSRVYVADWSDSHSGLWVGDPDFNAATEVLDSSDRASSGLSSTHGSLPTVVVRGTGSARTIYTVDEDYIGDGAANRTGSIWRYDIGTADTFSGSPSALVYDDAAAGNKVINFTNDMVFDSDGMIWLSQDRSAGTDASSIFQIDPATGAILWSSSFSPNPDELRRTRGLAWDPVGDYLAMATYNGGQILIFDDDSKTILKTIVVASNSTNRDVTFDAAGNLYVVDSTTERLQIYSPGGANSFTTASWFLVPEPATLGLLLIGGLGLLRRRGH